ncbi:MAG TPA: bifunctional 4-hydroxy-2-oxoglutarate aldolase/2-dehydro-3-deoxy-phosphogluconate aldolase [Lachnospiraceae bacterium]|nr:bifunctional 4-hydroxy-2-oxoglutarate aldolase/2-dehydro-3-deoxy-phosphogluconate aldolase [Lachnospiraceae bacterium]
MNQILEEIAKIGIVPVIALNDAKDALPLGKALCNGGLACAEITFRTDAAEESIRIMAKEYPDMIVGAGTVLTTEQADRAVAAGAKFIVSPGLNPKVVKHCVERGIAITPGCANPSDVEAAIELGLSAVKFFPAEAAGGLPMIKAMSAPYGNMKFMPTGGINESNLISYLDFNKIFACGGSWMVKPELIEAGEFDKIEELTRAAVTNMLGFELRHVGINACDENQANGIANTFEGMFGFKKKEGNSSIFAGKGLEIMKTPYLGAKGHIAIQTNYLERAIYHLGKQGYQFDMDTAKYDAKGNMIAIYFKDEVGDFAVHLVQR